MERFTDELTAFKWLADTSFMNGTALDQFAVKTKRSNADVLFSYNPARPDYMGVFCVGERHIPPSGTGIGHTDNLTPAMFTIRARGKTAVECANDLIDFLSDNQRKATHDPA